MLTLSSVLLQCLNEQQRPIPGATASGFIRREGDRCFLYTCWHVVTGFDPYFSGVPQIPPTKRHHLRISLQDATTAGDSTRIGGLQTFDLPLYENHSDNLVPNWLQDEADVPHLEINALGFRVPAWHDAVKLELPASLRISDIQLVDNNRIFGTTVNMVLPGDKVLVAGFPYGFSSDGMEQPTPVVLTRFVASTAVAGRNRQCLLESIGGAGMSGGPVYLEAGNDLLLLGVYTGLIYPDHLNQSPEKATALGTIVDLSLHFQGHLHFSKPRMPAAPQ